MSFDLKICESILRFEIRKYPGTFGSQSAKETKKNTFRDLLYHFSGVTSNFELVKIDIGDVRLS